MCVCPALGTERGREQLIILPSLLPEEKHLSLSNGLDGNIFFTSTARMILPEAWEMELVKK